VTEDGSRTLLSTRYRETYHSRHGAATESRHVFLEGSGVARRLAKGWPTTVLEVGFGAGLNTLLTLAEAERWGTPLRIVTLESDLLPVAVLRELDYRSLLPRPELGDQLLDWLASLRSGAWAHATVLAGSRLELLQVDARHAALPASTHAVYHDAFSPDVNPELWDSTFLGRLSGALAPGGSLVSYTVKGVVRRRLAALGFEVSMAPGPPGGKREMLVARRPAEP
jgi:tRNA U34 5-methylaminomethyl-2-thiouridine-forming methyltransferase MnmC